MSRFANSDHLLAHVFVIIALLYRPLTALCSAYLVPERSAMRGAGILLIYGAGLAVRFFCGVFILFLMIGSPG